MVSLEVESKAHFKQAGIPGEQKQLLPSSYDLWAGPFSFLAIPSGDTILWWSTNLEEPALYIEGVEFSSAGSEL